MSIFKHVKISVIVATILFCGILGFGIIYFIQQNTIITDGAYRIITTGNSLKKHSISDWFKTEKHKVTTIAANPFLTQKIENFLQYSDDTHTKLLLSFLQQISKEQQYYSISFMDADCNSSISSTVEKDYSKITTTCIEEVTDNFGFSFYYNHDSCIIAVLFNPIYSNAQEKLGILVFEHVLHETLYPILAQKPFETSALQSGILYKKNDVIYQYGGSAHIIDSSHSHTFFIPDSLIENALQNPSLFYTYQHPTTKSLYVLQTIPNTEFVLYSKLPVNALKDHKTKTTQFILIIFSLCIVILILTFGYITTYVKKQSYKRLYTFEQEFRTIISSMGDAVLVTNNAGIIQYINPIAETLIGLDQKHIINKHIDSVLHIEQKNTSHPEIIRHVLDTKKTHTVYRAHIIDANNKKTPIYESISPFYSNEHILEGLIFIIHDQTEERLVQDQLEESNRKIASLFSNIPGMFYRCKPNKNWDTEFVSDGVLGLTGYSIEEMIGEQGTYAAITHPDDKDFVFSEISRKITEHSQFNLEYRINKKDSSVIWVCERGHAIYNKNNEVIALEGYIENITERKNIELSLRESEELYRKQFEEHTAIQFLINPLDGKIINVNTAALAYYGYTKEEFLEKYIFEIDALSYDEIVKKVQETQERRQSYFEFQHRKADGTIRDVEVYSSPVEINGITYIHSIVHDVTDKKEAFARVELQGRAIEQSPVSIVITNHAGIIEYVNTKFCEVSGYSFQEAVGNTSAILKSGTQPERFYKTLWNTILSGKNWEGEFHNKKKNGEFFWEKAVITPIFKDGVITHFVAIKEDVTERKKLLEELVVAKEKAEESDKLKSAFLANMSHEIRTPMNGIIGFAEFFKDPNLSFDLRKKYADVVVESSKQLLSIVNDILDISRIESNTLHICKETVSVNEVIQQVSDFFAPQFAAKNLQFSLHLGLEDDAAIITDKSRIRQIITNLLSNAIKFTEKGEIKLGYTLGQDSNLIFYVEDSGIGISEKHKEIIFERFHQVQHPSKKYGGTGLGLAISHKICALLGGNMWVESEEQKGSIFYFTIPYIPASIGDTKDHNHIITTEKAPLVLVAEDDDTNYLYIETVLSFSKVRIIRAHNGVQAVQLFTENPDVAMVFMDVKMPKMNGFEASKKILEIHPQLPIIILSAFDLENERQFAKEIGCYAYIAKPIKKEKVTQILSEILQRN